MPAAPRTFTHLLVSVLVIFLIFWLVTQLVDVATGGVVTVVLVLLVIVVVLPRL